MATRFNGSLLIVNACMFLFAAFMVMTRGQRKRYKGKGAKWWMVSGIVNSKHVESDSKVIRKTININSLGVLKKLG